MTDYVAKPKPKPDPDPEPPEPGPDEDGDETFDQRLMAIKVAVDELKERMTALEERQNAPPIGLGQRR